MTLGGGENVMASMDATSSDSMSSSSYYKEDVTMSHQREEGKAKDGDCEEGPGQE